MSAPEVTTSPYEQLKNDLGYLQLGRALECFATIADQAKKERWSHVAYLAAVIAEQASATSNRRLAARLRFARFPFRRTIEEYTAPTVLVIDDVGLLPMARDAATGFFHVINTRYEKGVPTLVTSNRSLPSWGELFGDDVVAAAILDRILHRCVVFNIKGPSWRVKEHQGLTGGPSPSSNGRQRP